MSTNTRNNRYNNRDNNGTQPKKQHKPPPTCPPPAQIPLRINAKQVKQWCDNEYRQFNLLRIKQLHVCLKTIRKSVMQIKTREPETIDAALIREIEAINIQDPVTEVSLPQVSTVFDSTHWAAIFFALLPDHHSLHLTMFNNITSDDVEVVLMLYAEVNETYLTIMKEKITEEVGKIRKDAYNRFNASEEVIVNGIICRSIQDVDKAIGYLYHDRVSNYTADNTWTIVDECRVYLRAHLTDWQDPRVQMMWRRLTFDPLMFPSGYDIIDTHHTHHTHSGLFDFRLPAPVEDYITIGHQLRSAFYATYNPEDLPSVTQVMWEEWLYTTFFVELSRQFMSISLRSPSESDIIIFLHNLDAAYNTWFKNPWDSFRARIRNPAFAALGLLEQNGETTIHQLLNRVTETNRALITAELSIFEPLDLRQLIYNRCFNATTEYCDCFIRSDFRTSFADYLLIDLELNVAIDQLDPKFTRDLAITMLQKKSHETHRFEFWAMLLYFAFVQRVITLPEDFFTEFIKTASKTAQLSVICAFYFTTTTFPGYIHPTLELVSICEFLQENFTGQSSYVLRFVKNAFLSYLRSPSQDFK